MLSFVPEQYRLMVAGIGVLVAMFATAGAVSYWWSGKVADERIKTSLMESAFSHVSTVLLQQNAAIAKLEEELEHRRALISDSARKISDIRAQLAKRSLQVRAERPDDPNDLCASASAALDAELVGER